MRILYASERPPYPFFLGGAARCAHILLHNLSGQLGVESISIGSANYQVSPWSYPSVSDYTALCIEKINSGIIDCGYPVHILSDFTNALSAFIDEFKPDIIWSQLEGARKVLELAAEKGIQGLLYIHDAEFDPAELRAIADLGCHMVCSSGFLAEKVRKVIGRLPHVVYPSAELYFETQSDPHGFITMINPFQVKGVDTFFAIAKRLPSEKFLLLESWKLSDKALEELEILLSQAPNVHFQRRVSDMCSVYGQTKLLLVPSVWEEGFGMVAVEAQSCRIPVIASARGGLPESVGDGGILIEDFLNVDVWVEAINRVISQATAYQELADLAYCHAASVDFSPPHLAKRFHEACTSEPIQVPFIARMFRAIKRRLENV